MGSTFDALSAYKKAIRLQFEAEKTKEFSSFLMAPSRALLRNLCAERMKGNQNQDDLVTFSLFLGFEFNLTAANRLRSQTDKFRPIEDFFKGNSDLSEIEAVNMAAILVDFQPRPFRKFTAQPFQSDTKAATTTSPQQTKRSDLAALPTSNNLLQGIATTATTKRKVKPSHIVAGLFGAAILGMGTYGAKAAFFEEGDCMQWAGDHYIRVDCQSEEIGAASIYEVVPYKAHQFNLRKIKVCDTTRFFRGDKALVWYSRKNNKVEFFNGDGENPENGCELHKISNYMIGKYVKPCK